jgi:CYTH domain-containing protein
MNNFTASDWDVDFYEHGDPLWLIVAVVELEDEDDALDVRVGVGQANSREEALGNVPLADLTDAIFVEAYPLLSILSQAYMLRSAANLFDTLENSE